MKHSSSISVDALQTVARGASDVYRWQLCRFAGGSNKLAAFGVTSPVARERSRLVRRMLNETSVVAAGITQNTDNHLTSHAYTSASHKGSLTAAVTAGRPVGIDIETVRPRHPAFANGLAVPAGYRRRHGNRPDSYAAGYWSLLEAVWKCHGRGRLDEIVCLDTMAGHFRLADGTVVSAEQLQLEDDGGIVLLSLAYDRLDTYNQLQ